MTATMPVLCLASASPRRQELLCQIGVPNLVLAADIDETARTGEEPAHYVARVARAKGEAVWAQPAARCGLPVLAADTTVVLDGRMLGKPVTREEGVEMLLALAGRTHEVLTAVVLLAGSVQAPSTRCRSVRSQVRFRSISAADAGRYWESGEPRDKAGGYAVQGLGAVFVAGLTGSYSGVMGLPLFETAALLQEAGIPVWAGAGP
ncbi:MAG TPA: nucleoside triphosphate pyrophosphatase [Steroidobacteraceae bacterium]|nr:nucleoside triphosphate pyrophosphatase [Steroidobacteraceae bacterium]HQX79329.1 nucleoside triphosphate pyrophosphatase [Steroidobacteraceae bacterium]HQZ80956.1 nucleoside triphosphate pyrophosphatase [Steroidobacteraceae bacterium]